MQQRDAAARCSSAMQQRDATHNANAHRFYRSLFCAICVGVVVAAPMAVGSAWTSLEAVICPHLYSCIKPCKYSCRRIPGPRRCVHIVVSGGIRSTPSLATMQRDQLKASIAELGGSSKKYWGFRGEKQNLPATGFDPVTSEL